MLIGIVPLLPLLTIVARWFIPPVKAHVPLRRPARRGDVTALVVVSASLLALVAVESASRTPGFFEHVLLLNQERVGVLLMQCVLVAYIAMAVAMRSRNEPPNSALQRTGVQRGRPVRAMNGV